MTLPREKLHTLYVRHDIWLWAKAVATQACRRTGQPVRWTHIIRQVLEQAMHDGTCPAHRPPKPSNEMCSDNSNLINI